MRCIHQKWSNIIAGYSPNLLDPATVISLETLMPDISSCDAAQIKDMMGQKTLFPAVSLESDRHRILGRILKTKGRILSFDTFFADFLYFEACAMALKRLLPPSFKRTMSNEFLHVYGGSNQLPGLCRIQVAEDCLEHRTGSSDINPNLGYRQLFLAVMRDFPILTELAPYRDARKIKPTFNGSELERMFSLSQLAFDLGFETESIKEFIGQDSKTQDEILARSLLQQLRPPERCLVNERNTNHLAQYIGDHIDQNIALRASLAEAEFSTNLELLPKKLRCNRPSHKHYKSDRKYLFLDVMYNYKPIQRAYPTSLAVQRDIFVCFFGEFPLPSRRQQSTPASDSHYSEDNTGINTGVNESLLGDEYDLQKGESSRSAETQQHESYIGYESGGFIDCLRDLRAESEPMSESSYETASIDTESHMEYRKIDLYEPASSESQHENKGENKFYKLDGKKPSDIVKAMLKDRGVIVMYVWRKGVYATFSKTPHQGLIFTEFARDLANQGSQFIIIREGLKPFVPSLKNIWNAVRESRLVLVIPKRSSETPDENFYTEIRRDPYEFIDRHYQPHLDQCI
ncbi:hypothetical protein BDV40DRAFT_252141 [Aspergillus tamarii]|uniref:Uncharacterized protein n=1 Tax=Aspergillus tamarii TaxID=41984 RepID=A0A5N6VA92_ASPTM|nr:hypothetical protein BDV40DRAFT_252141 [Aspergillus tamarii]